MKDTHTPKAASNGAAFLLIEIQRKCASHSHSLHFTPGLMD